MGLADGPFRCIESLNEVVYLSVISIYKRRDSKKTAPNYLEDKVVNLEQTRDYNVQNKTHVNSTLVLLSSRRMIIPNALKNLKNHFEPSENHGLERQFDAREEGGV